jgi:hypothetical protein
VSTQQTSGEIPLKLPKYHYGGLGVRGAASWDLVDQVTMLTSTGADRKSGDNSKARWVHLGGMVDGQPAGIAVLIHPHWEISPGKAYVSRYRLVVADSAADAAEIERQWNDYATPPVVELRQE